MKITETKNYVRQILLARDNPNIIFNENVLVSIYSKDNEFDILLKCSPKRADIIIKLWNDDVYCLGNLELIDEIHSKIKVGEFYDDESKLIKSEVGKNE